MEFALNVTKLVPGKEMSLASNAVSMLAKLHNWTSRTQRESTAKLYQDKVGESFKIPASQKVSQIF